MTRYATEAGVASLAEAFARDIAELERKVGAGGGASYDDTGVKQRLQTVEAVIPEVADTKARVSALEAVPPYDDGVLQQRVQVVEGGLTGKADLLHGHDIDDIAQLRGIIDELYQRVVGYTPAPLPVSVDFMLSRSALADTLPKPGDAYQIPAGGQALLAPVDLRGKRVMHVVRGTADVTLLSGGTTVSLIPGTFTDSTAAVRLVVGGVQSVLMKWDANWHIYEYEVSDTGVLRFWMDGFEYPAGTLAVTDPVLVDRLGSSAQAVPTAQGDLVVLPQGDDSANMIREVLLKQYIPALAPLPQTQVFPLDTSRVTMLDPQMEPKALMAADAAQGIDRTNTASPNFYHDLAYRNHAEAPVEFSGTLGPMALVRSLVPGARYLRTGINRWQFDDTGTMLSVQYQAKLEEWVAAGGKWMPSHMWLGQEKWPQPITDQGTQAEIDFVRDIVPATYLEGWRRFWIWYEQQSQEMKDAIVVIDLLNEPDIFKRVLGRDVSTPASVWRQRFAEMQIAAARLVPADWRGVILSSGWGYSSEIDALQVADPYNVTPAARIKQALGNRLMWSFHQYPGWETGATPDEYFANTMKKVAFTGPNKLILTEMNVGDFDPAVDVDERGFQMARIMSRLTKAGVGVGHFPGINFAAVIGFDSNATPEFRRPDRTATFIDAATINDAIPYEIVHPEIRVQASEADPSNAETQGIHIKVGGAGGDTFTATTPHRTMFFGSRGDDDITISPTQWTWVFGQDGDDTIRATVGPGGVIFLGDGNDTVYLGADRLSVYGAEGADRFVLQDSGHAYIDNFQVGIDKIDVNGIFASAQALKDASANVGGHLVITMPGGGKVTLLKRGTTDTRFIAPDLEPDPTAFPALSGTIYHFRAEDVSGSGVETAHGSALPLNLQGSVGMVDVNGVAFFDGGLGGIIGEHSSWGDPRFSVWILTAGPRSGATAIYNGPPASTTGNSTLKFLRNGGFVSGDKSVSYPGMPAYSGPEVLNWDMIVDNGNLGQVDLYHNNVLMGAATGATSRVFDWTGTTLGVGAAPSTSGVPAATGVLWRDVVIKRNGSFTAAERAALMAYAQRRLDPAIAGPQPAAPTFTDLPRLDGSTALGGTITVHLGVTVGSPAPSRVGTLQRPGKAAVQVQEGDTFTIEASDQGGTLILTSTATNSAGTATETVTLDVPAAIVSPYQPDMTTGRIAPITTSFGGRPNVIPATYYFDGQDEMAAMAMGA